MAMTMKQLPVIDYISASANTTKTYTTGVCNVHGLKIKNDGASSITVTVNGLVMTILASEVFEEVVQPTNTFTITAAVAFRCWVRGV
jgi:hypothetical protein